MSAIRAIFLPLIIIMASSASAQVMNPRYYEIGSPALTDIWVDPTNGNDANSGASRGLALRTVNAAWNAIPASTTLTTTGYRIQLVAGAYPSGSFPTYWENRYGTYQCPVVIQSADGQGAAIWQQEMSINDCRYLYLVDFNIASDSEDVLHAENCTYLLLHGLTLQGSTNTTQETIKMNQCQYVYVEDSDVSGAYWMALDFVAVQYGHIVGNRFHKAEYPIYLKGGSAYFRVEANEIYDGLSAGFLAGFGTGFEFMVSPWLHYECSDIKFINNIIHDIEGAGMGVNGGYNILMAHNTLYRVGRSSHAVEAVFGSRSCDGHVAEAAANLALGGWGTITPGDENNQPIPNRNVYIYNNIIYNPAGFQSAWNHLSVLSPRLPATDSNIPSPAEADTNLRFRGNIFCNGPSDLGLGIGEDGQGGQASNPTCNPTQFRADNTVNLLVPELLNPAVGDFRPMTNGNVLSVATYAIPDFPGGDGATPPVEPAGNLANTIDRDYNGNVRASSSPPGAFIVGSVATNNPTPPIPPTPPTTYGPVILANNVSNSITIHSADTLSIAVSLNPGGYSGVNADWWAVAVTPFGEYYYDCIQGLGWQNGIAATYQGPLFNLGQTELLNISPLPAGDYIFYFGVDLNMDGQLSYDQLYYSSVTVIIE